MMNNKIIAVVLVAILAIAAVGAYTYVDSDSTEKKGLYRLDAIVSTVDMGKCTATPAVIVTIEDMYRDYYGDIVKDNLTLNDAKADTVFWNEYCDWTPIITARSDGTFDVQIKTALKGVETRNVPVCDVSMNMGTMYSETLYYLICSEYGLEVYSDESYSDQRIHDYMNEAIAGGIQYSYFERSNVEFMLELMEKSSYFDLGTASVTTLDSEKLALGLKEANEETDGNVVYFGSGTNISTSEYYNSNTKPCDATGSYYVFFSPQNMKEVFGAVECIGLLMGFSEEAIAELIEDIQLRLYKVYYSVQEKTDGEEAKKIYWEANSGKAINASMGKTISKFLGFDTSLLNGAEHDLESLLVDEPAYIVFYSNDARTEGEKMRINN